MRNLFITLGIVTILILVSGGIYLFIPVNIELLEIARLETDEGLPGTWWSTVFDESHSCERKYNIKLPDNDYNKNYLVISGGRELKELKYNRFSQYLLPYKEKLYIGNALLKKQLYPNIIFVYKIPKVRVKYDDISWPKVKVED